MMTASDNTVTDMIDSLLERAGATLECATVTMASIPGATFGLGKLQAIEAACKKLRTTHALHSDLTKDLSDTAASKPPPCLDFSDEILSMTEAVESLRSSVDGQLQKWRTETRPTRRMDVRDDRRRVTAANVEALEGLVREALKEGAAQLAASCEAAVTDASLAEAEGAPPGDEQTGLDDEALNANNDQDEAQLRSPIDAREESGAFPFPQVSSLDVATAAQPLGEWLLRTLPSQAKAACGVAYRVPDLAHMLLKAAVVMESSAAASDVDSGLMAMATAIVADLSGGIASIGAPAEDVRCCVVQAFVALFVYTVNLDGHYADPAKGAAAPLDAKTAMRLLETVEWKRQRTPEDARGGMPKKPAESDAAFITCTTAAPANKDAFGYNAAPWAVMNWTLRVRADPAAAKVVREQADRGARAYHVLAQSIEWALGLLPATHATVYRGIRGRTTRPYVQGTDVAWPAFSSTSTSGQEALKFMGKDRGTYFIVHSATARDVAFASWYPFQAERLLPPGRRFCVQSRVSDTVLTMLDSKVELIVMREATDAGGDEGVGTRRLVAPRLDDDAAAALAIEAVARTTFVFDDFVGRYVEGRLTTVRGSEAADDVIGVGDVASEIADGGSDDGASAAGPRKTCFVGGSGTGKTSAMLYVLSELARGDPDRGSRSERAVLPVFVSLPALRLWDSEKQEPTAAPVDGYVMAVLGLQTAAQVAAVAKRARLVVLLDSLDEVEEARRVHLRGAVGEAANPLLAKHASHVIVSTRPEAVGDAELLLGDGLRVLYCLPFTPADARKLLGRMIAQFRLPAGSSEKGAQADAVRAPEPDEEALWSQLEAWRAVPQLSNPFVASMCIETLLAAPHHLEAAHAALCEPTWQPVCDVDIYEAYLRWKLAAAPEAAVATLSEAHPRLAVATELALTITSEGRSHSTVEALGTRIEVCRDVLRMEALVADAAVSFRHKSLQEYLVARAIASELLQRSRSEAPSLSLLASLPTLTLAFPNVSGLLVSLVMRDPARFQHAMGAVRELAVNAGSSPQTVGTALAIMARTGRPLDTILGHRELEGRVASDADLNSIKFGTLSLRNAELHDCFLAASQWQGTDVTTLLVRNCDFAEHPTASIHTEPVVSVAFSPCGTKIASGSIDSTVKVHDVATGRELSSFTGHTLTVTSVSFSPCGTKIASGSDDKTVKVHDVATGREVSSFEGHKKKVKSVAFSPCGTKVASGSYDETVKVHDVSTGRELSSFAGHAEIVNSVSFSPCGTKVASGSYDDTVKVHDVATGSELSSFSARGVVSVAFSPCGTRIATGSDEFTVTVHNSVTGRELSSFGGHTAGVNSVSFSPCGTKIASGSDDKTVKVHEVATGRELSSFAGHSDNVRSVSFSPCGTKVASGSDDKTVKVHDVVTGREPHSFAGHRGRINSVAFSPCGTMVASGSFDKSVKEHDVATGCELSSFAGHIDKVYSVAFSPCGTKIASGSQDLVVKVHDVVTGRELSSFDGHKDAIMCVAFSPCGMTVASGSEDNTVKVHDVVTGRELHSFEGHTDVVNSVSFSPCGMKIASGSDDETVKVHDVATGRELLSFASHDSDVRSVVFSSCGSKLASGSYGKLVKVHDVATGRELSSFSGHTDVVNSVAFSPCGTKVASGSYDETVKVHDVATGRELSSFDGHTDVVNSVSFSPCGTKIASGSGDKTVKVHTITITISGGDASGGTDGMVHENGSVPTNADAHAASGRVVLDICRSVSSVFKTVGVLAQSSDEISHSLLSNEKGSSGAC